MCALENLVISLILLALWDGSKETDWSSLNSDPIGLV